MQNGKDDDNNPHGNEPEIRQKILQYIENNPGVHLRQISRDLGLAMGNAQYHLHLMETEGKIKTRRDTLYRHYYPLAILNELDEVIAALLRQETSRNILIHLVENEQGLTQTELTRLTNLSAPTISWHMSRLITSGLVTGNKEGRMIRYLLKKNTVNDIAKIVKTYHPSIWNTLASRLAELFLELSSTKKDDVS